MKSSCELLKEVLREVWKISHKKNRLLTGLNFIALCFRLIARQKLPRRQLLQQPNQPNRKE